MRNSVAIHSCVTSSYRWGYLNIVTDDTPAKNVLFVVLHGISLLFKFSEFGSVMILQF